MTPKASYITTSWDDGHPLDLRLAELLCKYSLPATFYIPLHNDEHTVLMPQYVRELSATFEIGAHTIHHSDLRSVPGDLARREISDCKTALEQIIDRPCTAFCFPKGHFRRHHLAQIREAGYRLVRTVELMSLAMPRIQGGIAIMPTSLQAVPAGFSTFARNSLKRLHPANLFRYVRYHKANWAATAEAVLEHVLKCGGVFHLWGHSWEIEEMGQWQNVERVFALLAQCKTQATFVDNTKLADEARM
jgi:peptidoglycan/xylan/chitin deacetylase (PgdA/CDA1 family)